MKIVFSGGGTAGHVYPAIAMAEEIYEKYPNAEFLFIGREGGEENSAISKAGYPISHIKIEGLKRGLDIRNISVLIKAFSAEGKAKELLSDFSPDVVIGTGGYVSYPVVAAAIRLGIPTLLHESNAVPGLVTRLLSKRVNRVMLGFCECESALPKGAQCIYTGNPVRRDFTKLTRQAARRLLKLSPRDFVIVSFGGSLGAEALNKAVISSMLLEKSFPDIVHIHATGRRYYEEISKEHHELIKNSRIRILPYIDNMPKLLSAADLAITRSGAITTAELTALALPSILIPSPNVAGNHQVKNARAIEGLGGALVIEERELSKDTVFTAITELHRDRSRLNTMSKNLRGQITSTERKSPLSVIEELL